jgi:hypothetical protein
MVTELHQVDKTSVLLGAAAVFLTLWKAQNSVCFENNIFIDPGVLNKYGGIMD